MEDLRRPQRLFAAERSTLDHLIIGPANRVVLVFADDDAWSFLASPDAGETWIAPEPIASLSRDP